MIAAIASIMQGIVSPILNVAGLSAYVWLFATDRLLTRGQHLRRIADIEADHTAALAELREHQAAVLAAKDVAYQELKGSRDYYRQGRLEERDRAEKVTNQLAAAADVATRLAGQLASTFDEVKATAK